MKLSISKNFLLFLLPLLVSLPALPGAFYNDDLILRGFMEHGRGKQWVPPWGLYDFMMSDTNIRTTMLTGHVPWWTDVNVRMRFFRPLSSLSFAADAALFGWNAVFAHVHSLLWFGAVLGLVWRIHRVILPPKAAFWATLVFGVSGAHAVSIGWAAARHLLISGAFGLWALLLHLERRERGLGLWCAGAVGLFLLSLLGGESALSIVPFILAVEWFGRAASLRERALRTAPLLVTSLLFLVAYASAGYGTREMGTYVSPLNEPLRFIAVAVRTMPILWGEMFGGIPTYLMHVGPSVANVLGLIGTALAVLVVALVASRWSAFAPALQTHLVWLGLGTLGSLVPVLGGIVDGRVLVIPMLGASAFLGVLLVAPEHGQNPSFMARAGRWALLFLALGLSPLARVVSEQGNQRLARIQEDMPKNARLDCRPTSRVFILNGHDPSVGFYSIWSFVRHTSFRHPAWITLSMARNELKAVRRSPTELEVSTVGERQTSMIEWIFRSPERSLRPGESVDMEIFKAHVLESAAEGPTRVNFRFSVPLDDPNLCFAYWKGGQQGYFQSVRIPEAGELVLPYEPGPMQL